MPPQRTIPPAKAIKTERTHEENQERAYIAASRRSDRSLEARVESARRASEIHKRRTGRSLRVTEQDVVNEEMYEEEDDDLPAQYRRLTAHLQTGSADFNRRLAAYLTNHVAMRSALDQAITSSYAQQFPNAPQPSRSPSTFQSPLLPQHMMQNGSIYRQSPYPTPDSPAQRSQPHARASSIATPLDARGSTPYAGPISPNPNHHRRMSMPTQAGSPTPGHPTPPRTASGNSLPHTDQQSSPHRQPETVLAPQDRSMEAPRLPGKQSQATPYQMPFAQSQYNHSPLEMHGFGDTSPFSMSLPPESQMLLGGTLDPHDPLTSMLMAGSNMLPQANFNPNQTFPKEEEAEAPYNGMNTTLALSALEMTPNPADQGNALGTDASSGRPAGGFCYGEYGLAASFKPPTLTRANSTQGDGSSNASGTGVDWGNFIDDASWEPNTA
ncbi:MAG: hypothetical protein M1833_005071 [Piccolia ochrophora]|nr:MAG: hypothetical protein M1833_005071 [Piccolia ochrophora]